MKNFFKKFSKMCIPFEISSSVFYSTGKIRRCLRKAGIMKQNKEFFWIDESGRKWTGEQIKHKFDRFIKKAIKHRTRDAVTKLLNQDDHFPVQPESVMERVSVPFVSSVEKQELMLGSTLLYTDDERLIRALNMLTERERLIFEKFYLDDETDKAIGEWLHLEAVSVKSIRIRAIRRIRKAMGVHHEEEGI